MKPGEIIFLAGIAIAIISAVAYISIKPNNVPITTKESVSMQNMSVGTCIVNIGTTASGAKFIVSPNCNVGVAR